MRVGAAGDLRKMGDRNNLVEAREALQALSHRLRDTAAHADVDFIEHKERETVGLCEDHLDREHDS